MCPGSRAWSRGFLIDAPMCLSQDRARSIMPIRTPATLPLLATTVVGSFPQPEWLVDRDALLSGGVPRGPRGTLWRGADPLPRPAPHHAPPLALRALGPAGIGIVHDRPGRPPGFLH